MSTPELSQGRNFPNQKFGWVLEPDGTWSLYSETGVKLISTTPSAVTIPSLPGGSISVTDGTTTVSPASVVDFTSNATVTRSGTTAEVAVSGGGSQPFTVIRYPFAFDTPNLVLTPGVQVYAAQPGDIILPFISATVAVTTAFDGTNPTFSFGVAANLDAYDGEFSTYPLGSADSIGVGGMAQVESGSGASPPKAAYWTVPENLFVKIDDGDDGDPGCTMGEGLLTLLILNAS